MSWQDLIAAEHCGIAAVRALLDAREAALTRITEAVEHYAALSAPPPVTLYGTKRPRAATKPPTLGMTPATPDHVIMGQIRAIRHPAGDRPTTPRMLRAVPRP
jgi:hypothetical protein